MLNSIPTIESKNVNNFGDMANKHSSRDYWLSVKKSEAEELAEIQKKKIESKLIITPDEARKTKNAKLIGWSIAGATIFTAATIFFLLKGGPKGLSKNFQKFRDYLEDKVQKAKLNNMSDTRLNRAYIYTIRKLDGILHKTEAINNFTTFKDILFKKIMYVSVFTRKIHDSITKMFEKIGRKAVVGSYKSTSAKINGTRTFSSNLGRRLLNAGNPSEIIELNGVRRTRAQWVSELESMNDELGKIYENHFGDKPRTKRYLRVKQAVQEMQHKFEKLSVFLKKDVVTEFMAESAISKAKLDIQNIVKGHRRIFSYSYTDLGVDAEKKIMELTRSVSYKDIDKINKLRNLRWNMREIIKTGKCDDALKGKIMSGLEDFRTEILKSVRSKSMDEKTAQKLLEGINELKVSFNTFKQGKVEDILAVYRSLLSPEEFARVEKYYMNNVKALDKSINVENEEFMNKVRDLALGSAPTDILTVLGSFATLGYYLGTSDSSEERKSISLKYGIPALAGVGTALYCNAKLYAGTKSLIFGLASTWILNRIGTWADNLRKKNSSQKVATGQAASAQVNNTSGVKKLDTVSAAA